jgi:hypothetical protein
VTTGKQEFVAKSTQNMYGTLGTTSNFTIVFSLPTCQLRVAKKMHFELALVCKLQHNLSGIER